MSVPPDHSDPAPLPDVLTLDPDQIPSAVLRRLIREVQQEVLEREEVDRLRASDLVHNHHNRGR